MKWEIARWQNVIFHENGGFEDIYAEAKEFNSFDDALKSTLESIMFGTVNFTRIDREKQEADFIVLGRMRYENDSFYLRPSPAEDKQ